MGIKLDSDTFFSKKVLLPLGLIISAILIIMLIVGSLGSSSPMEDVFALNTRLTNLTSTVDMFDRYLKSSNLRASSSSLSNLLAASTSAILPLTTTEEYASLSETATEEIVTTQTAEFATLNNTLENARLNARLDPTFANEISYQIAILVQLEQSCLPAAEDNESVQSAIQSAITNLNALYSDLQNYQSK